MTNRNDDRLSHSQFKNRPYRLVAGDRLSSAIWKHGDEASGFRYGFNIFRMLASDGRVSQEFEPEDVLCLVKLAQIVATVLVDDGGITAELRRSLSLLAMRLDVVFGQSTQAPTALPDPEVLSALRSLMFGLWEDCNSPECDEPPLVYFRQRVELVERWLAGARTNVARITPTVVTAARTILDNFGRDESMDCEDSNLPYEIFTAWEIFHRWLSAVEEFGPLASKQMAEKSN